MEQLKINGFQLFCVIFLFELGSAVLVGLAKTAMQDGWITVGLATICGLILYLIYAKLYRTYPAVPLTNYIRKIWGNYIGWIIGLIYVISYIYSASRVLRDFEELLVTSAYSATSLLTVGICMLLCIMYAVYKGFEVFARVAELCFFIMFLVLFAIILLEFTGGLIHLENLQPILEHGWQPVFKALFPTSLTFPFGEMIAFTMILPYVHNQNTAKRAGIAAVTASGLYFVLFKVINVSILGADIVLRSAFPMLIAVSYINVANFVQRLEALVIISMVVLGFIKVAIYFFCAVIGSADLFHVKQSRKLIYPIGCIILVSSIVVAPNYVAHINESLKVVTYYLALPLQIVIPILLLITVWIKKKIKTT